jgi:hypothetical protein
MRSTFNVNETLLLLSIELASIQNAISLAKYSQSPESVSIEAAFFADFASQKEFFAKQFLEIGYEIAKGLPTDKLLTFLVFFLDENNAPILFKIFKSRKVMGEKEKVFSLLL